MDDTKDITVLSLCTGYGGLELGLHRALGRPLRVVAVEIEAFAAANLVAKAEEGKLAIEALYPDLSTFPSEGFYGCFDFLTAGIPCQPWSVAGKQDGIEDERWIWDDIYRIIKDVRPGCLFFEEVPGFVRGGGLGYVLSDLAKIGYDAEWDCFRASDVGAPHKRERLFILGYTTGQRPCRGVEDGSRQQPEMLGAGPEHKLADTGHNAGCPEQKQQQKECTEEFSRSNKLADSNHSGCKEQCWSESVRQKQLSAECSSTRWPARPGQAQYEWEEPRVVADNNIRQSHTGLESESREAEIAKSGTDSNKENKGQAESRLGGKFDGNTCPLDIAKGIRGGYLTKPGGELGHDLVREAKMRVDRLRLLGNGCVPQTVELAWRTLRTLF